MEVRLYGTEESVYTRMVRLVLLAKEVEFVLIETDPFEGGRLPEDYNLRHPFKRIPAIEMDGVRLYETDAVVHYIDAVIERPALTPSDAETAARMRQIMRIVDNYAYRPLVWGYTFQSGGVRGWNRRMRPLKNHAKLWEYWTVSLTPRPMHVSTAGPWRHSILSACLEPQTVFRKERH